MIDKREIKILRDLRGVAGYLPGKLNEIAHGFCLKLGIEGGLDRGQV